MKVAAAIATALAASDHDAERRRAEALRHLEQRRTALTSKLDRAYEDYLEGRISPEFWRRKSDAWEAELRVIDVEGAKAAAPHRTLAVTAGKF